MITNKVSQKPSQNLHRIIWAPYRGVANIAILWPNQPMPILLWYSHITLSIITGCQNSGKSDIYKNNWTQMRRPSTSCVVILVMTLPCMKPWRIWSSIPSHGKLQMGGKIPDMLSPILLVQRTSKRNKRINNTNNWRMTPTPWSKYTRNWRTKYLVTYTGCNPRESCKGALVLATAPPLKSFGTYLTLVAKFS